MSRSLLWRHIGLLTSGVYPSNHRVLYTIGISMTRRFQLKCRTVRPSVCPFVTLTKKPIPSSLLVVERQFAYQVKGLTILYKKIKRYF